jgi:hypothetical protein
MKRALALVALVLLAGCSGFGLGGEDAADTTADPTEDRLGWEEGHWYNDSVAVDASDGLNESELDAVTARAMARLERIRGLEFEERVPVEVISRAEYREENAFTTNETQSKWNNQVWEGLLLVGEQRNITEVFQQTYGSAVLGYYSAEEDRIVVVSDSDEATVDVGTLVHELAHALQDQHFDIEESPPTQDEQLARNSVVEGEASLLERRYLQQCGKQWDCVQSTPAGGGGSAIDRGVLTVISYPYIAGPTFVETIEQQGGWAAVSALHDPYPDSTEQVSSPSLYPDDRPSGVDVADHSTAEWDRFDHDPAGDTLGQASMQVMLEQNDAASGRYASAATDGWAGDELVPYRNGQRYGYVWVSEWDSSEDAREFRAAYLDALDAQGAIERPNGVYVVTEDSPFGDAFHVTRTGDRVRIVNAPTVDALGEVHGDAPA